MRKVLVIAGFLAATAIPMHVLAADDHHATVQADGLKWSAPAAYGTGAQLAVVKGDPTKDGMYVVRRKRQSAPLRGS
jgi:hypothetical protein